MSMVADRPVTDVDRADLGQYARSDLRKSLRSLATSLLPFLVLWAAMFAVYPVSYWLVLLLAIPASAFLVRTYIMFHDCVHGSLLSSRRANAWLGTALGLLVFTPFARWRYEHLVHHATAGDLDRRFIGDVPMLTVAEYRAKPWWFRAGYRAYRSPFVMFGLGRSTRPSSCSGSPRPRLATGCSAACGSRTSRSWCSSPRCASPSAGRRSCSSSCRSSSSPAASGIWLFYVQHQFQPTYWERTDEWSFNDAALAGSSHLALPKVLQFFSGNIGFHHVHHLNPKIPNYNLPARPCRATAAPVGAEHFVRRRPPRRPAEALGRADPADGHLEAGARASERAVPDRSGSTGSGSRSWESDLVGLLGGERFDVHHAQPVGLVGIADQCVRTMRDQHRVMHARHHGEVRQLVTPTPRPGAQVVRVQPVSEVAVSASAVPVAQQDRTDHLR